MDEVLSLGRKNPSSAPSIKTTLSDISGGGCSFNIDSEVMENDFLCIGFSGTNLRIGLVECQVVRVKMRGKIKRTLHVKFTDISEEDRTKIVLYINDKLIEERKEREEREMDKE
jgi:c-di-GMP-binding flagellar brake protein YcgR